MSLQLDPPGEEEGEQNLFSNSRQFNQGIRESTDSKGTMNTTQVDAQNNVTITSDSFVDLTNMSIAHESLTGTVLIIGNMTLDKNGATEEAINVIIDKDGTNQTKSERQVWIKGANEITTLTIMATFTNASKNTWKLEWKGDDSAITKNCRNRSLMVMDI